MADKLGLGPELRELKIGQSFTNPRSTAFHTIRYDFKPASVDVNKMAYVDVGSANQVSVTVPHLDSSGVPQTVFKGSQKPYQKECVLVIDRNTGEITLERLSSNVLVKKTRNEVVSKPMLQNDRASGADKNSSSSSSNNLPTTGPIVGQRNKNRTKVTSGPRKAERVITQIVPKHSPLHASPNYSNNSMNNRSPKRPLDFHQSNESHSTLASLPRLGGADDYVAHTPPHAMSIQQMTVPNHQPPIHHQPNMNSNYDRSPNFNNHNTEDNIIEEMSDSSSSSSSSDSDSDHESTLVSRQPVQHQNVHRNNSNGYPNRSNNNSSSKLASMPSTNVFDDLQLSEDDSD